MRASFAIGIALAVTFGSACGGGSSFREATEDDLPELVLDNQDLPDGFEELPDYAEQHDLLTESGGASAANASAFTRQDSEGNDIEIVCSYVSLYDDEAQARKALASVKEASLREAEESNADVEELLVSSLGEDSFGIKVLIDRVAPCAVPTFPAEGGFESSTTILGFVMSNTIQSVTASNDAHDRDRQEYVDIAKRQFENSKGLLSND